MEITGKKDARPYTLIVKNARLALKGDMLTNALYVVPDGKVIFADRDCDSTQYINGLFMASE